MCFKPFGKYFAFALPFFNNFFLFLDYTSVFLHGRFLFGDICRFSGYLKSLNMSNRRHKSRERSRSRSPSSRQNSVSSPDVHHEGSPPKRRKNENDSLQKIPQSIESVSNRIGSLESRANQPETITDTDDEVLSVMAGETSGLEISEPLATEASFKTARAPLGDFFSNKCCFIA